MAAYRAGIVRHCAIGSGQRSERSDHFISRESGGGANVHRFFGKCVDLFFDRLGDHHAGRQRYILVHRIHDHFRAAELRDRRCRGVGIDPDYEIWWRKKVSHSAKRVHEPKGAAHVAGKASVGDK